MARISEREYFDIKLSRLEDEINVLKTKLAIALKALELYSWQEIENEQRAKDYAIKMNTQKTAIKALEEIRKLSNDDDWEIVE